MPRIRAGDPGSKSPSGWRVDRQHARAEPSQEFASQTAADGFRRPQSEITRDSRPSYLRGHSGISRASSRHSGAARGGYGRATQTPDTVLARLLVRPRVQFLRRPWVPVSGGRSALGGHAAASIDGQVSQAADRLASTRARRAAAARDVRSPGTASPVPKYISSGVCPRNAECGSTPLCSWT